MWKTLKITLNLTNDTQFHVISDLPRISYLQWPLSPWTSELWTIALLWMTDWMGMARFHGDFSSNERWWSSRCSRCWSDNKATAARRDGWFLIEPSAWKPKNGILRSCSWLEPAHSRGELMASWSIELLMLEESGKCYPWIEFRAFVRFRTNGRPGLQDYWISRSHTSASPRLHFNPGPLAWCEIRWNLVLLGYVGFRRIYHVASRLFHLF